ncbi:Rho guanine nucleotide exchange factor 11 [Pelomyxa schiedti]|nr:Rho guanine nucleotide exchange factor 11 [Pelomyxa schiedti]
MSQRSNDDANNTNIGRVLVVSRLVWEHVVSPGWLDGPRDSRGNIKCGPDGCRQWDLFRAAEAMFPIVGLVCRRALAFAPRPGEYIGSYSAIVTAASVPAPSCVAWILNNRHVRGKINNDIGDLFPTACCDRVALLPEMVMRSSASREVDVVATSTVTSSSVGGIDSQDAIGEGGRRRQHDHVGVDVVVKEVSATVAGLLMGGHVGLATTLCGGGGDHSEEYRVVATTSNTSCTLPRLWDGRRVVSWETACRVGGSGPDVYGSDHLRSGGVAGLREKVIEYMRGGCGQLHFLWLVDVLGIGMKEAPLVMYEPMRSCVHDGKMEVVKWLFERFGFGSNLHQTTLSELCSWCSWGPCPGNLKWFTGTLQVCPSEEYVTRCLVSNKHSTVEDCKWQPWVERYIRGGGYTDLPKDVHNPEVVKWLVTTLSSQPSEDYLNRICKKTGDMELTQWLVTEHNFTPTAATFASACSTSRKKGSTLARWLSPRVSLSETDIIKSLVSALSYSNIEVAEWLNETFHVMDSVNSNTEVAENCLVEFCTELGNFKDKVVGFEWFLQHLSPPHHSGISMSCIHEAISQALPYRTNAIALLLETFPAVEPLIGQAEFEKIVYQFMKYHLNGFQCLCSGSRSSVVTPEFIGQCLTSESFHPYSSKVVKWVIQKFNLQYSQIKRNNNWLLFKLFSGRKNRCALWLLNRFDVPLSDIVDMAQLGSKCGGDSMDLTGWHMILDRYGTAIDGALIRKHLMPMVSRSPHVATHIISSFGLTIDEFREDGTDNLSMRARRAIMGVCCLPYAVGIVIAMCVVTWGLISTHFIRRLLSLAFATACSSGLEYNDNGGREATPPIVAENEDPHYGIGLGWCDIVWCLSVRSDDSGVIIDSGRGGMECWKIGGYGSFLCLVVLCALAASAIWLRRGTILKPKSDSGGKALGTGAATPGSHQIDQGKPTRKSAATPVATGAGLTTLPLAQTSVVRRQVPRPQLITVKAPTSYQQSEAAPGTPSISQQLPLPNAHSQPTQHPPSVQENLEIPHASEEVQSTLSPQVPPPKPQEDSNSSPNLAVPEQIGSSTSPTCPEIDETAFKRFKIIEELFVTEDSYIADLYIISTCFVEPLEKILKPKHFQALFCNITSLVRVNSKLLAQLKKAFQEIKENPNTFPPIGEAFLSVKQDMTREYTQYLCGQSASQHTLQKIQYKPKLAGVLQEIGSRPECRKLQLQAFLVKPLQRLTKYPLMLKSLLEVLPEPCINTTAASPEPCDRFCSLSTALAALQFLNTRANAFVKSSEVVKRVEDMVEKVNYKRIISVLMPPSLPQTVNCMPPLVMEGTIALQTSNLAEPKEAYLVVTQSHFLCVMPKKLVLQTKRDLLSAEKSRIEVTDTPGTPTFQVRITPEPSSLNPQRQSQSPSPSSSISPSPSPSPRFPLRTSNPDQQHQQQQQYQNPSGSLGTNGITPRGSNKDQHQHPDVGALVAMMMPPAPGVPPPTPPQPPHHHISRFITRPDAQPLVFVCSSDSIKSKWLEALSS